VSKANVGSANVATKRVHPKDDGFLFVSALGATVSEIESLRKQIETISNMPAVFVNYPISVKSVSMGGVRQLSFAAKDFLTGKDFERMVKVIRHVSSDARETRPKSRKGR